MIDVSAIFFSFLMVISCLYRNNLKDLEFGNQVDWKIKSLEKGLSFQEGLLDVNKENAHPSADILIAAEAEDFDEFKNSATYSSYRALADQLIAEGALVKEFYFLTEGKYNFSTEKEKYSNKNIMPIPLGIRQLLQYRQQLLKLAKKMDQPAELYLQKAKLILHVDEGNQLIIEKNLKDFDWFDFSPENLVILVQPKKCTYSLMNGKFVPDSSFKHLSGHGDALMQVVNPTMGECYTFSPSGKRIFLNLSAAAYLREKGAKWLLSASDTDLTQLTHLSLDPDRLAMALFLESQGYNFILETVENLSKYSGAYWVREPGEAPFIIHTIELLHTSHPSAQRSLDYLLREGALFSRFAHYIKLDRLEEILLKNELPLYVELERALTYRFFSFSHDISKLQGINTVAFHQKGEAVHLFRLDDDVKEALAFMAYQDSDSEFKAEAKRVYLKRVWKHLSQPLKFQASCVSYPWAGNFLPQFKKVSVAHGEKIGETWEISAQTENSSYLIVDGQVQPLTLQDLMQRDEVAEKIVGSRVFAISRNWFPILYKFLDAAEILSVQVHPKTELARELGEKEPGKSESWVVLEAKQDASIYVGLKDIITYEKLASAIYNKENLLPLMKRYRVKTGDVLYNVPGVIHAIGGGIFVAEVQGNSDVTYRLYDHHRLPERQMHIPQALRALKTNLPLNYNHNPRIHPYTEDTTWIGSKVELLVKDPYYELRRVHIGFHDRIRIDGKNECQIFSVISGQVHLKSEASNLYLCSGETVLIPAISSPLVATTKDSEAQILLIQPGEAPEVFSKPIETQYFKTEQIQEGPINLAISIGGTKLVLGALNREGIIEMSPRIEWKKILEDNNTYKVEGFIELIMNEFIKIIEKLEKKGVKRNQIQEVGVAWPGPGKYSQGVVSATFLPGFHQFPLGEQLSQQFANRLGIQIKTNIILDAWADAYGEMSQNADLKNWIYINIATGVAAGIVKEGKVLDTYSWPDKPSVKSGLGQIGRHLIRLPEGIWQYRPTMHGDIPVMVKGETRLTDWIGGPALATRFIDFVFQKAEITDLVPDDFFGTSVKKLKKDIEQKNAEAIRMVLEKVQKQAEEQNATALEMIRDLGRDIGKAIRTFADAFPGESFCDQIIIGGGVVENLGKNILISKSSKDILLYNVVQTAQIPKIFRTKMDVKRELLAFKPAQDSSTLINSTSPKMTFEKLDNLYGLSSLPNFSIKHQSLVEALLENDQAHLFNGWECKGTANSQKFRFLEDMIRFNEGYDGGIEGYLKKHKNLVASWRRGALEDFPYQKAELPEKDIICVNLEELSGDLSLEFAGWEENGLQNGNRLAVVLVAGGTGKRLGYKGIKVGLPLDTVLNMSSLERYSRWIKAIEEETNRIHKTWETIPLFIMTSEETYEETVRLLNRNNYFGLKKDQIVVMRQESVPAIAPRSGKIGKVLNNPYAFSRGGAGHGVVHQLMYQFGFAEKLAKENRYILFVQDTNSQIVNGALVALACSIQERWDLNFLATSRDPKEAASLIVDFYEGRKEKERSIRATLDYALINSEFNILDQKSNATILPHLGYTGAILIKAQAYVDVLRETQGKMIESIRPKNEDDEARIECRYEDIAFFFSKEKKSGVTYFTNKRLVFSPIKNSLDLAAKCKFKGNYPDAQGTGESDFLKENRRLLRMAGVQAAVDGSFFEVKNRNESECEGYNMEEGAKVILSPDFAPTRRVAKEKVDSSVKISSDSVLAIRGKNIVLKNVVLEGGGLILDVPDNIHLYVHDISLKGGGWHYRNFKEKGGYYLERLPDAPIIDTRVEDLQKIFQQEGEACYELTQEEGKPVLRSILKLLKAS
jgi:mannose-6-phosphate isomerase class I/predicted NBD/HSP70 family sugar kinase